LFIRNSARLRRQLQISDDEKQYFWRYFSVLDAQVWCGAREIKPQFVFGYVTLVAGCSLIVVLNHGLYCHEPHHKVPAMINTTVKIQPGLAFVTRSTFAFWWLLMQHAPSGFRCFP
jgi:hypothetical protein